MRNYIYILKLDGDDKEYNYVTFSKLIDKLNEYCELNNIQKKITMNIIKNIFLGRTKNNYIFIKRLERIDRLDYAEKYLKEELELRFPDYKTKELKIQKNYITKILRRREIL